MANYVSNQNDSKIVWPTCFPDNINDHTPWTAACVTEGHERLAFGVLNDVRIGQPSDIASVTFGG